MGGHAFLELTSGNRISKSDYEKFRPMILSQSLVALGSDVRLHPLRSYGAKETFGDLDIVTTCLPNYVVKSFTTSESGVKRNGNTVSVLWWLDEKLESFQVDFLCVPEAEYDFACSYLDYNDLGNLLGRTFKSQGFSLGHQGLKYKFPKTNKSVTVTLDWGEALEFMGFVEYKSQKFDTLEDLFQFATSSSLFSKEHCLLGNRNHKSRARDGKRPVYQSFMKWLDTRNFPAVVADKDWHLGRAFVKWPTFMAAYVQVKRDFELTKAARAKFNGDLVTEWTGLFGKQLGYLIQDCKQDCLNRGVDWRQWAVDASTDEIKSLVQTLAFRV